MMRNAVVIVVITLAVWQYASGQSTPPSLPAIGQLILSQEFDRALEMDDQLLKQQPNNPQLWLARAVSLRGLNRTRQSLDAFKRVLILDPTNVVALKGATEAAFSIRDPSAGAFVEKLLLRTPEDPVSNAMAGSLAYERPDCHSAVQHFEIGMPVVQKNTLASLQFSHCLISEGQAARAVEILDELPTRDSDETVSYDLAFALFSAGRYQESAARLESLKARGLGGAAVSDLLASAYGKLDRVQDALDAYRSACDEAPTVPGYYIDLVQFAMEHTSENAAIEVLNTAIARIPNSSALLTIRGSIYAFIGDTAKAEQDFAKAERVEPTSGYGRLGRSLYLRDQGRSREAEAHLRKELASNPKDVKAKYFLAEILMDSDSAPNRVEPKRLLEDVRKKRPNDPNVLLLLGKILLEEKNPKAALPLLLRAHQVDPTSAPVLNRLLQVYRALGLKEDAGKTANGLRQIIDSDRNAEARRNRFHIAALPTAGSAR